MGSGWMPYHLVEEDRLKVVAVLLLLDRICLEVRQEACEGDQFDNSYYDGKGVAQLELAQELLRKNMRLVAP